MTSPTSESPLTRIAAALPAVSLAMLLAAGLASTLHAVGTGRLALWSGPVTQSGFLNGQTMRSIADALARAPQPRVAADAARAANWLLLNDLGPQVRQGCPDWLFLAEELAPHPVKLPASINADKASATIFPERFIVFLL